LTYRYHTPRCRHGFATGIIKCPECSGELISASSDEVKRLNRIKYLAKQRKRLASLEAVQAYRVRY
jgi:hypothetical protein